MPELAQLRARKLMVNSSALVVGVIFSVMKVLDIGLAVQRYEP
jgi:hypothetical protein